MPACCTGARGGGGGGRTPAASLSARRAGAWGPHSRGGSPQSSGPVRGSVPLPQANASEESGTAVRSACSPRTLPGLQPRPPRSSCRRARSGRAGPARGRPVPPPSPWQAATRRGWAGVGPAPSRPRRAQVGPQARGPGGAGPAPHPTGTPVFPVPPHPPGLLSRRDRPAPEDRGPFPIPQSPTPGLPFLTPWCPPASPAAGDPRAPNPRADPLPEAPRAT